MTSGWRPTPGLTSWRRVPWCLFGQVGDGSKRAGSVEGGQKDSGVLLPVDVSGLASGVTAISGGDAHTCGIAGARQRPRFQPAGSAVRPSPRWVHCVAGASLERLWKADFGWVGRDRDAKYEAAQRTINVWSLDHTAGSKTRVGSLHHNYDDFGTCPAAGTPLEVKLTNGHLHEIVFVDTEAIGCEGQDDPLVVACRRDFLPIVGLSSGPAFLKQVN